LEYIGGFSAFIILCLHLAKKNMVYIGGFSAFIILCLHLAKKNMVFCEMCACFSLFVICCSSQVLTHSSWWSFVLNPIMGTWSIPASTGFEYMVFFFPNDLTHSHFILTPCIKILNSTCMGDLLLQPHGNSVLRMI